MSAPELTYRMENGWLTADGGYLCDGCLVQEPSEHRCHQDGGGIPCTCTECREIR